MMIPWKQGLISLAYFVKRLAGKTAERLSDILESFVSAILSFLRKVAEFVRYMSFGCFCCRLYCVMVNAKTKEPKLGQ